MSEREPEQPAEGYETPQAEDVEIVAGTSETATGNVSQVPNIG